MTELLLWVLILLLLQSNKDNAIEIPNWFKWFFALMCLAIIVGVIIGTIIALQMPTPYWGVVVG